MSELKIKIIENRRKYIPAKIKQISKNYFFVQTIDRTVKVRTSIETILLPESQVDIPKEVPEKYHSEKYVSKCFFQCTAVPCWYRESLIMNLASTKKHFNEEICFEQKLTPFQWSEGITKEIQTRTGAKTSSSKCFISVEEIEGDHYISLEPQQTMAALKQNTTVFLADMV